MELARVLLAAARLDIVLSRDSHVFKVYSNCHGLRDKNNTCNRGELVEQRTHFVVFPTDQQQKWSPYRGHV